MKRPSLFILIYALIGIFLGICLKDSDYLYYCFAVITIFTVLIIIFYKKFLYILLLAVALMFFYISSNSGNYTNLQIDKAADTNTPVIVQAVVNDKLKEYEEVSLYKVTTKNILYTDNTFSDNINMYIYIDKNLTIGDIINFNTTIKHGNKKRNDSDYNEILNYKIKNIEYKAYPSSVDIIGHENKFTVYCNYFSNKIKEKLYQLYPDKEAGIITAMILGDKINIDDDVYSLYRFAGIVHIIAISGLHISIFAGILLFMLKPFNKSISSLTVMLFLMIYCIFTGGSVSVLRATIMMYFYILSGLLGRKYDLLSSAAVSCCLLLICNPYYIFDLGFQYSYAAVFTIGFTSEILDKYKINNKLLNMFIISFAVTLATKPITVYNFYYINIIDVFVNIIAISLIEIILILALISIILGFIYIKIAEITTLPVYVLLKVIEKSAEASLALPLSHINIGAISLLIVATLYVLLFALYKLFMGKPAAIPVIILCIALIFICTINRYNDFEAEFMYVGQGDCTILKDKDKCYFIDAGSNTFSPTGKKILNQLNYENIHKIDGIYISHMDYDHMGAILEIVGQIQIESIIISKYCEQNENYNKIIDVANKNNINVIYVDQSYSKSLTKDMIIELVCLDNKSDNTNNSSPIYRVSYENKRILFTGDIDSETAEKFLNYNIGADILKVPHHGSKYSASQEFITAVNPYIAINFAGYNNIYKHPSPETLNLYKNMKIPFLSTEKDGIIKIRMNKNGIYYKLLDTKFDTIKNLFY